MWKPFAEIGYGRSAVTVTRKPDRMADGIRAEPRAPPCKSKDLRRVTGPAEGDWHKANLKKSALILGQ